MVPDTVFARVTFAQIRYIYSFFSGYLGDGADVIGSAGGECSAVQHPADLPLLRVRLRQDNPSEWRGIHQQARHFGHQKGLGVKNLTPVRIKHSEGDVGGRKTWRQICAACCSRVTYNKYTIERQFQILSNLPCMTLTTGPGRAHCHISGQIGTVRCRDLNLGSFEHVWPDENISSSQFGHGLSGNTIVPV